MPVMNELASDLGLGHQGLSHRLSRRSEGCLPSTRTAHAAMGWPDCWEYDPNGHGGRDGVPGWT